MKRSDGERIRLGHSLERLLAYQDSIKIGMRAGGPVGAETAGGLVQTALEVAMQIAKLDAFTLMEQDIAEVEGAIAARVQQAILTGAVVPKSRWRILSEVSPSGKTLFVCLSCGNKSPSPSNTCPKPVKQFDGTIRECSAWEPSPFEVQ